MIGRLDYPAAEIKMHADTDIERDVRLNSSQKEPETVAFIEALKPGSVLYDIGANVGAYTLIAVALGIEVICFEPAPANAKRLHENLELNGRTAKVLSCALGEANGWLELDGDDEAGRTHAAGAGLLVPMWSLDLLRVATELPAPSALKIDVDGYEGNVLWGARSTLTVVSSVLIETTPATSARVGGMLRAAGLRLVAEHPHKSGVTNEVWKR